MTFIQVLNNPEGRSLVDQIEDVQCSLRAYPKGDRVLEDILTHLIDRLWAEFGFQYVL